MSNEPPQTEICRVCGEASSKFVRTVGVYRSVIFELISEIAGIEKFYVNKKKLIF